MKHNVIIETCETEPGTFRADVVQASRYFVGLWATAGTRDEAYRAVQQDVRLEVTSRDTFDFIHVESQ